MTGKIKKLNKDKGFGFIRMDDGSEAFFHRSAVQNGTFDDLREGQQVFFEMTHGQKGPRAEDVRL